MLKQQPAGVAAHRGLARPNSILHISPLERKMGVSLPSMYARKQASR